MHLLHLKAALNNFGLSKQRSPEYSVVKYNSRNDLALLGDVLRHVHAQVVRTRRTGDSREEKARNEWETSWLFSHRDTETVQRQPQNFLVSTTFFLPKLCHSVWIC